MAQETIYATHGTTLDEANPNVDWSISPYIVSGLYYSTTVPSLYRCLLYFDLSLFNKDTIINNCFLNLYVNTCVSSNVTDFFTPYLVTSSWTDTTKWSNQPGINYSMKGSSEAISGLGIVNFNITSLVRYWIDSGINNGLVLKSTETLELSTKTFVGTRNFDLPELRPHLTIEYNKPVPVIIYERKVENVEGNLVTSTNPNSTMPLSMGNTFEYTIFVKNTGSNKITLSLEVSPDGKDFVTDRTVTLSANELLLLTPKYFSNYIRFTYNSFDGISNLKYWIIKQI